MKDFFSKRFREKSLAILSILLIGLAGSPWVVMAKKSTFEIKNPLSTTTGTTIPALINSVTHFIFLVGVAVAPVMILVGAFYFMTAAGNEDRISKAKKIILYALIGVAILYMADILMSMIKSVLGVKI